MTTELEKQFFDTFGVEPYDKYYNCKLNLEGDCKPEKSCRICEYLEEVYCYPQITDRHYLELICLVNERRILPNCSVNKLKEYILKELCTMIISESFKHQVLAIFEGER